MSDEKQLEELRAAHNQLIDAHNAMIRKFNAMVKFVGVVTHAIAGVVSIQGQWNINEAFKEAKKELEK